MTADDMTKLKELLRDAGDADEAAEFTQRVLTAMDDQRQLLNLLARIHRDGGHYTEEHGLTQAVTDADLRVANLNGLVDAGCVLRGHEATYCLVDPPCGGCNACAFNAALAALSST